MNHKALAAGVLVALVGVVLLFFYMKRYEAEASGGQPVRVLMVRQDYAIGEPLSSEGLAVRELPQAYVEDRHVLESDKDRILGIRANHELRANQSLLWTDLATAVEGRRDLSGLLRRGMRAMTIHVRRENSIVSLLQPGDRVDLLYTGTRPGTEEVEQVTVNLLQNVLVLACGHNTGGYQAAEGDDQPNHRERQDVSVALTVEQAALITHAIQDGNLDLALRNPRDIEIVDGLEDVTDSHLIEPAARQAVQRRRVRRETQEIERIGN